MTDPIADMLIRIKNAYLARHKEVKLPYSKIKEAIAKILKKEGFINDVSIKKGKYMDIVLALRYVRNQPVLTDVRRISKPGRRVYVNKKNIPRVVNGFGIAILSTPQGLMTGEEARKKGLGGEVICEVW